MTDATADKLTKTCAALYGAYALSMLLTFTPYTMVLGLLLLPAALVMAYVTRGKAAGAFQESHLQYLVRTFWIGGCVYLPVLTVLATLVVFCVVDMTALKEAIRTAALENQPGSPAGDQSVVIDTVLKNVMVNYGLKILAIVTAFTLPAILWWFWRCWHGFALLRKSQPVDKPESWL